MLRKALSCVLALALTGAPQALLAQAAPVDPEITKGIKLVDDGDYDGAILTLDNAARRLAQDPAKAKELSQAYLYLGIAYVGKGHDAAAKAKFREALGQIKDLTLSPDKFPPKVINVFEEARAEESKSPTRTKAAEKKGGGGKAIFIIGGVAAVGGIAAAAGGGGGSKSTTPTTTPDPRRTETFTGTVCMEQPDCNDYGRGYDIVVTSPGKLEATVTWTNANIFFSLDLSDENYETISRSNRITNTSAQLSADVSPRTSSPGAAYHLFVGINTASAAENYTLTVKHP